MIADGSKPLPKSFIAINTIYVGTKKCNRAFYACGDSTTYGAGSVGGPGPNGEYSWCDKVAERIAFSAYSNLAISGGFCMYDSERPTKYLLSEINSIPQLSDCIVPIMIGTNDFEHQHPLGDVNSVLSKTFDSLQDGVSFAESFRLCVETLKRKCPLATIICMTPLSPQPGDNLTIPMESYKEVERTIAKAFAVPVIETSEVCGITYRCNYRDVENEPVFVTEDEVPTSHVCMSDRLHPTNLGYELIARYMVSYLSGYVDSSS
jgi:lysophospholipase L1-like esterase